MVLIGPTASTARSAIILLFLLKSNLFFATSTHAFSALPAISAKWTDLTEYVAPVIPPRSGHVAFTPPNKRPKIFGGYAEEADENGELIRERYATNDMWVWSGVNVGWTRVDQQGDRESGGELPGPRLAAAAATTINGHPLLFGGWDPQTPGTGGVILDSTHEFDPESATWSTLDASIPDGPTSRHIALNLPSGDVLIHNHRCTDHVIIYSVVQLMNLFYGRFNKQPTSGTAPSSRGLHAATRAGDNAVIFGGAAQNGEMSNEAFILDTNTWEWKEIATVDGVAPCPRAAPCLCTIDDYCVLLFGGAEATDAGLNPRGDVWALHFDPESGTGKWELLMDDNGGGTNTSLGGPPPRNAATMSEIEYIEEAFDGPAQAGEIRKCFILQGGWAPFRKTWNDNFVLSVSLTR